MKALTPQTLNLKLNPKPHTMVCLKPLHVHRRVQVCVCECVCVIVCVWYIHVTHVWVQGLGFRVQDSEFRV
jgi:hypothetical protein